ncbi:hypothetical protein M0804_012750 [Polistes exclamans]|nr:hypothetical protein M0804_012750 [Polistes exclamans]
MPVVCLLVRKRDRHIEEGEEVGWVGGRVGGQARERVIGESISVSSDASECLMRTLTQPSSNPTTTTTPTTTTITPSSSIPPSLTPIVVLERARSRMKGGIFENELVRQIGLLLA